MRNQKINERKQATPPGIPIASLLAFCVVVIPVRDSMLPLGLAVLNLRFLLDYGWVPVSTFAPVIILVIAELLYKPFWRSLLFSVGSVSLIVEWLIVIREIKHMPWLMALTSLPFVIFVIFWNARSLSFIVRLDKRWASLP
jgi:hypothetical protein